MATVQFSILPSFHTLVLPDHSPIDDAIQYILLTLRRSPNSATPPPSIETCKSYSTTITHQTGVLSVGELRGFTDADFKALQVPAMLRIYLKYLVRGTQSGRALGNGSGPVTSTSPANHVNSSSNASTNPNTDPFLLALQNDFNYGQAFDLSQYKTNLDTLSVMGFDFNSSMEALCMVENKNVEAACELLLSTDAHQRKEKRAKFVERLGRQSKSPADSSNGVHAPHRSASTGALSSHHSAPTQDTQALVNELALVRAQLTRERTARLTQSQEYKNFIETTLPLKIYTEYLKSLLVKEYILPVEMEQLTKYRERNSIDMKSHVSTLMELGIESISALDSLVKKVDKNKSGAPGAGSAVQQPGDLECVVCLDKPKTYIITNCMHLCLCEDCATSWMKSKNSQTNSFNQNCPICSKKITQIMRIYL